MIKAPEETIEDRAIRKLYIHIALNNYSGIESMRGPALWASYGFNLTGQYTHVVLDEQRFLLFLLEWA